MTIFDKLKYTLSEPPTELELEALPKELYKEWLRLIYGNRYTIDTYSYAAKILGIHFTGAPDVYYERLKLLNQLIANYDDF